MNERQWVQATLRGDKNAFANIVEQYQVAIFNLAYRLLGNRTEAEDAAQESFVRAYVHLSTFNPEKSLATWLLSITAHHCIDKLRRGKRARMEPVDDLHLAAEFGDPEKHAVDAERNLEIRQALDSLPDHYRLIVVLRYWYDLSYREIGEVAGLGEGVVKIRLHRAREMLARQVAQRNGPVEGPEKQTVPQRERAESDALFKNPRIDVAKPGWRG